MRTNYVAIIPLCRSHKVPRNGSIHLEPQLHGVGKGVEARRFANVRAGLLHTGRVPTYALPSVSWQHPDGRRRLGAWGKNAWRAPARRFGVRRR